MSDVPRGSVPIPAARLGRVHFIGVGGAGMSGIARILLAWRIPVSGSDAKDSRTLAALRALGAAIQVGHHPEHVHGVDTVVVSTAICEGNPELVEARRLGLRVLPRAAALAAVMAGHLSVAVAGTHGKTTTTSMLTVALQSCGVDPSFAIGGDLGEPGSNAHAGTGSLFVAEADESDGSFLLLTPSAAIVTNIETDHVDHYPDLRAVEKAFAAFVDRIDPGGFLVACADDPAAAALAGRVASRLPDGPGGPGSVLRYGTDPAADLVLADLRVAAGLPVFTPIWQGDPLDEVRLSVPGRHNALNAAAALAAGLALGQPVEGLLRGITRFTGARRRFEFKGSAGGVRVVDDYAHHPTEITATLRAARDLVPGGRLVVAFQPHRYSRTAAFATELGRALGLADIVVAMAVYPAGEEPIPGVTGARVATAVPLPPDQVIFEPSWAEVVERLVELARPGDLVLTLGAGDVTLLGEAVLDALAERRGDQAQPR